MCQVTFEFIFLPIMHRELGDRVVIVHLILCNVTKLYHCCVRPEAVGSVKMLH